MPTTIRETLDTPARYMRHPPADAAGSPVADGRPMDAGTWAIIVNNCAVLYRETLRHLVSDLGPGDVSAGDKKGGWNSVLEDAPEESLRTGLLEIAWRTSGSEQTAQLYGPFPALLDHNTDPSEAAPPSAPRKISATVRAYGTTGFKVWVALTSSPEPPSSGALASELQQTTGTTVAAPDDLDFTLEASRYIGAPTSRFSDPATGTGSSTPVRELYLWLGWRHPGDVSTAGILSFSAWEVFE